MKYVRLGEFIPMPRTRQKIRRPKRQLTGKPLRLQGGFLYVCAKEYTKFEAAGVLFHAFQVFV
ncbi:MAG: hypothetical protein PHV04_08520, partial [Clostridia bacterium]|nr:hypothetical protein [Clostridia bacterium]